MKLIFAHGRWLFVPLAFSLFATSVRAETRTVKLTVNVVSLVNWKSEPVAGANVTLTPSTGGPTLHRETSGDGSVTVDVPAGAPGFGEGWLFSEPSIQIAVVKDSQTGASTVNIRTKEFKATPVIEIVRTVTLSPPPAPLTATSTTRLIVRVVDDMGNPISGASVNITRDTLGPEFQYGSSIQTGPDGVATTDLATKGNGRFEIGEGWLYAPTFDLEVRKDSLSGKDTFKLIGGKTAAGFRYPESVTRTVVLRSVEGKQEATIYVEVHVKDDAGDLEGASVVIWDLSLGVGSGRFPGVTGGGGLVTIPVLYGSADQEEQLPIEISKNGYKPKKIGVSLKANQIGKKVTGTTAVLEKSAPDAVKVIVTVRTKKGLVGEARVVLDGPSFYSDTTGGLGTVTFLVSEMGTFSVEISHDNFLSLKGEIRLLQDDKGKDKPVTFELEPRATKDQGGDTIEVTVLGKDSTDEKSPTSKISGAFVKAGSIGVASDGNGVATLTGAFEENQEIRVEANGYKTKTRKVHINKTLHQFAGSGSATFTLDPELSDSSPIRLSIDVRDPMGNGIPNAKLDFSAADGTYLPLKDLRSKTRTDSNGNFLFHSSNLEEQDVAALRKGLVVSVTAAGYKQIQNRSIPAGMLEPSTKTTPFLIEMERDWSDLEAALAALEQKVAAWQKDRGSVSQTAESDLIEKARAAQKHAAQVLKEIEAAKDAFGITFSPGGPDLPRCRKAKELKEDVQLCEAKANQKAEELKRLLDAASASAANCSAEGDPDIIKKDYADATKLLIEIGALNKKAGKDRDELVKLAAESSAGKKLLADMDAKLAEIGDDKKTADETVSKAAALYARFNGMVKGFAARRLQLYAEFGDFKSNYHVVEISLPPNLETRIQAVENALNPQDSVPGAPKPKTVPESVSGAPGIIAGLKGKAEQSVSRYRSAACDVDTMDEVVDGIYKTFTDASFEVGMGADLPKQADDCAKKIAEGNNVDVPDLSTLNDLGAMTRAAEQAGMVLQPTATGANPPAGSQRLFGPQNPLAKSKAKKGDPLTIIVYQKLAQKAATPAPTPVVVASASPKPTDDYVDVPSVAAAKDAGAMSKILSNAGFTAVFHAATPTKKEDELKYAGQDPVGLMKKSEMQRRGNEVIVSINQSWQPPATAQATPTPELAKPGTMPTLIGRTLDQAAGQLGPGFRIGSDEVGDAPPSPELALTIYGQFPPAGHSIPPDTITVVAVRRYGEARSVATADASPDASPVPSPGDKAGGATDITNTTTSSGLWGSQSTPAKSPPPSRTTSKKTTARKPSAPPPPSRKKKMSDWWRRQGHDRPDYEVPQ